MNSTIKILLTGYMGSGKSYVGKWLSNSLKTTFIDLDELIELNLGKSIADIFNEEGEAYFRQVEKEKISLILKSNESKVVSLGGGTYCQDEIHKLINEDKNSFTVYLKYAPSLLADRLQSEKEHRPILSDVDDLESFISEHLDNRKAFYENADLLIVDETDVAKISQQIHSYQAYFLQKLSTI